MSRTKIADRVLPDYTHNEELVNMLTHILGVVLGLVALILCCVRAALHGDPWGVGTGVAFGVSMILLYTTSSVYHGWENSTPKKVLQAVDHCVIYLLIAGTFTPVCLTGLRESAPAVAWTCFSIVCAASVVGVVFTAIDLRKYRVLSMVGYLAPWCTLFALRPLLTAYPPAFLSYIIAGGAVYTVGALVYMLGSSRFRYAHALFHLFILGGSLIHFLGILRYCM